MKVELLKLQNIIIERYKPIRILLFMVILFSVLLIAYSLFKPSYVEQNYVTSSYSTKGVYSYTTYVNGSNPLYPVGTVLPPNQPAYFYSVSPILNMAFTFGIDASDSADVSVSRKTIILATAESYEQIQESILWQKEFPVVNAGDTRLSNGDIASHNFSINLAQVQAVVQAVKDDLQYSQETNLTIITYVDLEGSINGKNVDEVLEYSVPLLTSDSYYQLSKKLESNNTVDIYSTQTIRDSPHLTRIAIPLALLIVSTISLVALRKLMYIGPVDPSEIIQLEKIADLAKFNSWISQGEMPVEYTDLKEVKLTSLQGLVDTASEMDMRVIHDNKEGIYFTIHDGVIYTFYESEL
ncbi:DUF5305 family protein [uncultured Methanomethylovorans sp.]|uniref:DUF5305 family protein n=1 Tax=uncultured Methanomethylovorans sp. TaxID=183759 RepID=UPI002AA72502|nr:DUF5305 family protein [uncultured Methanomethylovorans sp.]